MISGQKYPEMTTIFLCGFPLPQIILLLIAIFQRIYGFLPPSSGRWALRGPTASGFWEVRFMEFGDVGRFGKGVQENNRSMSDVILLKRILGKNMTS
jgi:hypothetical protein